MTLTPVDPAGDSLALFASANSAGDARALWRWMPSGPFDTVESFRDWMQKGVDTPDIVPFTVRRISDQKPIGQIRVMEIVEEHRRAELGSIWYLPEAQRTHANTEACFLLLAHLFDQLGYRRAEWKCHHENERSSAAALRLGFTYEGTFRKHLFYKGMNRDTRWYSIIDDEWPARRERLRAYLDGEIGSLAGER